MTSDADGGGSKVGLQGPSGLWSRLRNLGIDTEVNYTSLCIIVVCLSVCLYSCRAYAWKSD